jgi:hypothetical protein
MKWLICTIVLLFASGLMAQQAVPPSETASTPSAMSEPGPAQIPDAGDVDLNDPAVAMTLAADSVTLPDQAGPLRHNELAYSIGQPDSILQSSSAITPPSSVRGQN